MWWYLLQPYPFYTSHPLPNILVVPHKGRFVSGFIGGWDYSKIHNLPTLVWHDPHLTNAGHRLSQMNMPGWWFIVFNQWGVIMFSLHIEEHLIYIEELIWGVPEIGVPNFFFRLWLTANSGVTTRHTMGQSNARMITDAKKMMLYNGTYH